MKQNYMRKHTKGVIEISYIWNLWTIRFFFNICEEIGNEYMFSASFTKTKAGRAIYPHPSTKKPDSYPDAALEFDH